MKVYNECIFSNKIRHCIYVYIQIKLFEPIISFSNNVVFNLSRLNTFEGEYTKLADYEYESVIRISFIRVPQATTFYSLP